MENNQLIFIVFSGIIYIDVLNYVESTGNYQFQISLGTTSICLTTNKFLGVLFNG